MYFIVLLRIPLKNTISLRLSYGLLDGPFVSLLGREGRPVSRKRDRDTSFDNATGKQGSSTKAGILALATLFSQARPVNS